ncbi:UDP-N-acetylmuramoylalanyl-D-glutamate--2,6-diaminopimelate ligase [Motilibacter rhizosphaerae]|uniref:UDP-N-acetylmuramoyl-L-alanyl-D-glutamate--2,6-diaminopimelate ligase n=1 Tax=Motilibacter rhizosphaerae TaxID=598652 RepID=A0A4V2F3F4_9ACTN|nr:UDP-N-acetylmuramoyl-L-alanyl-D-glutamate--2,6-diaminopimelate ligase [Motilibacter rhizosphaerae]RZS82923.1 UDP-N-acetylmuramoylalanyl-D-glutamate--2,6-diaminopimelate ligase [Motilibacter rhizosphaerae]
MPASPPVPPRPTGLPPVALAELAAGAGAAAPADGVLVSGVTHDSRDVRPGDLYAALPGAVHHGAEFGEQALRAGAVAALTDPAGAALLPPGLPALVVDAPRTVLGPLAASVYGHPAERLLALGVTGTSGKTTTTYLLDGALRAAGATTGLVGTVETRIAGEVLPSSLTTPEAPQLQALLAVMVQRGCTALAMEVSSHALALGRVDGTVYDVAGFTNLGRDHLDFHRDMADYLAAKARLFTPALSERAVVCTDTDGGRQVAAGAGVPVTTVATAGPGDWTLEGLVTTATGSTSTVVARDGRRVPLALGLPGAYNAANALVALAVLDAAGLELAAAARALAAVQVPGRMERVDDGGSGIVGIVDYAHKPEAVEAAVRAAREGSSGRVLVVLGAGGDRDRAKRPLMGGAAARLADVVVVTDDNPRSEDPAEIRAAVLAGTADGQAEVLEVGDRAAAIAEAVSRARPGDVVAVLGKGHERGQLAGGVLTPFDDREALRGALAAAGARA